MLSIDINHPDVEEFATIKSDLTKVTGANISIRLNQEFMKAVENNEDYILRFPCNSEFQDNFSDLEYNKLYPIGKAFVKKIKAKELWNTIVEQARNNAEPGLLFWDNVLDYSPDGVYPSFSAICTNPCGEIPMGKYDSCRLMCLNLFSFVTNPFTDKAEIDYEKLYKVAYEQQRLADDLVDLEIEYIDKIISKIESDNEPQHIKQVEINLWTKIQETAKKGRRTGCGITALADMLAALGVKYDSDKGLEITDKVMKTKMEAELDCTIDLAILRGPFKGWDKNMESSIDDRPGWKDRWGSNSFYQLLYKEFPEHMERMYRFDRRNVSWSTVNGGFIK